MADDYVLVVARWMHFSAAMVLFGSSLFPFYMGDLRQIAWRSPRPFAISFACAALFGTVLWLYRYAAEIGEPDQILATAWVVLTETSFRTVWIVRLAASLLLVAVTLTSFSQGRTALIAGFAATLLVTEGWDGHVVGAARFGPFNQALHLLAAGFWLGSLVPLAAMITKARSGTATDAWRAAGALRRYSNLALVAVLVVAATGSANTWLILGAPPSPFASYGRALILKIGVFCLMLLVATLNRFVIIPRLNEAATESGALGLLSATILLEQVLGAAILLDVSLFGLMDPAG